MTLVPYLQKVKFKSYDLSHNKAPTSIKWIQDALNLVTPNAEDKLELLFDKPAFILLAMQMELCFIFSTTIIFYNSY